MQQIKLKKDESLDGALKRLKEMVTLEGTLDEVRRLRAFETPKERRIRKARRTARIAKYIKTQIRNGYSVPDAYETPYSYPKY
jgi:small subunit ribosomal protein S21